MVGRSWAKIEIQLWTIEDQPIVGILFHNYLMMINGKNKQTIIDMLPLSTFWTVGFSSIGCMTNGISSPNPAGSPIQDCNVIPCNKQILIGIGGREKRTWLDKYDHGKYPHPFLLVNFLVFGEWVDRDDSYFSIHVRKYFYSSHSFSTSHLFGDITTKIWWVTRHLGVDL